MPQISKRCRDPEEERIAAALAARDAFEATFRRSRKGNLWRHWEGKTLTAFKRGDGFFGWSIAADDGVRFSSGGYEEEADAIGGLWDETEGLDWM